MGDSDPGQLRSAMRFSMWTWAAYWPGGGLMLLAGGMTDPISISVALLATAGFLFVVASGALRAQNRGKMTGRDWLLERPIYLLVLLVVCAALGSVVGAAANIGLFLFSGLFVASIVWASVQLRRHVRATGKGVFASGADQLFLLFGLVGLTGIMVFLDTFASGGAGGGIGTPSPIVAILNWVQLAFPPLLLVASRPFREKLNVPFANWVLGRPKRESVPEPVQA